MSYEGKPKSYRAKFVMEFEYSMYVYDDSEDAKTELMYRLDDGFQTFLKDCAHNFEPETIEILEVKEIKK